MAFNKTDLVIYEGLHGQKPKRLAVGLTEASVRNLVSSHWAYGEPNKENSQRLGREWSKNGWHVEKRIVQAAEVKGELLGIHSQDEIVHLSWECPYCRRTFSEDVKRGDTPPILTICSHKSHGEQYILVHYEVSDLISQFKR